ncbi:hypothetical protein LINGRAHAP2_LOCUS31002 [Linum grandiflorum]
MMISALSNSSSSSVSAARSPRVKTREDSHHSEAVADCIEFIKKTSAADDEEEGGGGGGGRYDYSAGNVRCCSNPNDSLMPVPVIM